MSDHFDRLLARHTPAGPGAGPPARVRPRLPGPFERVDALRHGPDGPDEPPAPFAAVPASEVRQAAPAAGPRHEVRSEHRTVVRTESVAGDRPAPVAGPPPVQGLLRPAADARPVPQAAPRAAPPAAARPGRDGGGAPAAPVPAAAPPRPLVAPAAVAVPAARVGADAAAARGTGRAAAGGRRGGGRPAERVVHVQIGRLEVSAAPPPGDGPARSAPRAGRAGPVMTLDDYLSRGGKRD